MQTGSHSAPATSIAQDGARHYIAHAHAAPAAAARTGGFKLSRCRFDPNALAVQLNDQFGDAKSESRSALGFRTNYL